MGKAGRYMKLNRPIKVDIKRCILSIILIIASAIICYCYYQALAREFTGDIKLRGRIIDPVRFDAIDDKLSLPAGEYKLGFVYSSDIDHEMMVYNSKNE